jgi:hypothetical protein
VAVRQRRDEEVAKLLDDVTPFRRLEYWNHASLRALRLAPESRKLRDRYPPEPDWWSTMPTAVLLLKAAPAITPEQLTVKLERPVAMIERSEQTAATSFSIGPAERQLVVTLGTDRYELSDGKQKPAVQELLRQHQGWLSVNAAPWAMDADQSWREMAAALALLGEQPVALYLDDGSRFVPFDDSVHQALSSGEPLEKMRQRGERVWLFRDPRPATSDELEQRNAKLPAAFAALKPGETIVARVALSVGDAEERQWATLERMYRNQYGTWRCIVRLRSDSTLMPHLRRGEPLLFWQSEVLDWKIDASAT